jgi:hypothetical protein
MKYDLRNKWKDNDKVGSLQIAIQSCKLLHDTSNAVKFYLVRNFMPLNLHMYWK